MTQRAPHKRPSALLVDHIRNVLVVDDNEGIRKTMRFALEDAEYSVYEACDGAEALDYLRACAERLVVLLDLNLPRLDGWSLLRAVSETPLARQHRFVLITAQGDEFPPALIRLLGQLRVPVIAKPCNLDVVLDAVAGRAPIPFVDGGYAAVGAS